jgi:hypothetical protein
MNFDADPAFDLSQYCTTGAWFFYNDNGTLLKGIRTSGLAGDVPAPGDYNGDGKDEVIIFRNGQTFRFYDFDTGLFITAVLITPKPVSTNSDPVRPMPIDYDSDGADDFTVFAGGAAWRFYNDNGSLNKAIWTGGVAGDLPVPANYDGVVGDEVVVYRNTGNNGE